jgi:hypothetical protein
MNEPDINDLILNGAVEISGVDSETGELLYTFTPKMREILPELYKEHLQYVNEQIMHFWQMGFVEFDDMFKANPKVFLTDKAFDEEAIDALSDQDRYTLVEIKRILKVV